MSTLSYISGGIGMATLVVAFVIWFIFGRDPDKEDSEWPTPEELKEIRGW